MYCNAMDTHACSRNLQDTIELLYPRAFMYEICSRVVNYELRDLVADSPLDGG